MYDGRAVRYDGFSAVFVKFLENGISDGCGSTYKPVDGTRFMSHLKDSCYTGLTATDAVEI